MKNNESVSSPVAKNWIVFSDGEYKKMSEVNYLPNNQALNYGTGIFEGIRGYWNADANQLNLFRIQEHYCRLVQSAEVLKLDVGYSVEELVQITISLIKLNNFKQDVYIRPMVLKKSLMPGTKFGVKLSGINSTICINILPMNSYVNPNGITCHISKWQRISNNAVPCCAKITGVYVNSALAYDDAQEQGFDDAIMLNAEGYCTEATTSNIFIVDSQNTIKTPPVSAGILNGITRQSVMEICQELKLNCCETNLSRADLYNAKYSFSTGTGVEILPILKIDDHVLDNTNRDSNLEIIIDEYNNIKRGNSEKFKDWLTVVS